MFRNSTAIYILLILSILILGITGWNFHNSVSVFWAVSFVMLLLIWFCNVNGDLLKDGTAATNKKPYSYARVQLAWWTIIILSSFTAIFLCTGRLPTFNSSDLILLGIGVGTTTVASMIDVTDKTKNIPLIQDIPGDYMLLDILTDKNGISISRLQAVIFNVVIGAWYVNWVTNSLANYDHALVAKCGEYVTTACKNGILEARTGVLKLPFVDSIMPVIDKNNLILLGMSAGTYVALKTNENSSAVADKIANVSVQLTLDDKLDVTIQNAIKSTDIPKATVTMKDNSGATITMQPSALTNIDFSAMNVPSGFYTVSCMWQITIAGNNIRLGTTIAQGLDSKTKYPLKLILTKQA